MSVRKKLFMLKKLYRDISSKAPDIINDNTQNLSFYYLDFKSDKNKLNKLIHSFDENGVPLNTSYIDVESPRLHYYPISIGQFGLAVFHQYLKTGLEKDRVHFLNIANWFVSNVITDEKLGAFWLTDIPKPEYNVSEPWKSAFSQSRALSILLRAWQLTGNSEYKDLCIKALKPFLYDISEGGVATGIPDNAVIYEEYVAKQPTRVLDGAMFSLFGVNDFIRAYNHKDEYYDIAKLILDRGVQGLKEWLPKFDMGYWVYFNRCDLENYPTNDPCTIGYLKLVNAQLKIMNNISGEKFFTSYRHKFKSYLKTVNVLKMYREKYYTLKKLKRL